MLIIKLENNLCEYDSMKTKKHETNYKKKVQKTRVSEGKKSTAKTADKNNDSILMPFKPFP